MNLTLSFITSFLVSLMLIPIIIKIAKSVNMMDQPDKRKIHRVSKPSMAGIAIFIGLSLAILCSLTFEQLADEKYFLAGIVMIFLLGVRDDFSSLQAKHKLVVQLFAGVLVIFLMGVKIKGLNGLFGIDSFGWYFDELFTLFVIVIMTNAFNLIDGIDGLAGSIGILLSVCFASLFYFSGLHFNTAISLSLAGATAAFLIFNWYPSKVFMGDTGSMMIGFILTVLLVKFLQIPKDVTGQFSPIALVLAFFILPVYDTLRVFFIRLLSGNHPLSPDRNHIHHILLKLGLNHGQATSFLVGFNVLVIALVFIFQSVGEIWLILSMATVTITVGSLLDRKLIKKEAARTASLEPHISVSKTA